MSDGRASPMNYQVANGDHKKYVRIHPKINNCVSKEQLYRATVMRHTKNRTKATDGRTFTIF